IRPWLRRLISRGLAIIPAAIFIGIRGEGAVDELLVFSQVVLSLQLSFAVLPLITFTSDRVKMGEFRSPAWVLVLALITAAIFVGLNHQLVAQNVFGGMAGGAAWLPFVVVPLLAALSILLLYVILAPWIRRLHLFGEVVDPAHVSPMLPAAHPEPAPPRAGETPLYKKIA